MKKEHKLIIFDADGTLRYCTVKGQPCPNKPGEWEVLPKVREKLSSINWGSPAERKVGYGIASNQGGVGMGYFSHEMAFQLLRDMFIKVFGIEPENRVLKMSTQKPHEYSEDRKPKPKMLIDLINYWIVEPEDTLFVGDMESDKDTAQNAGCDFMWAKDFFGF